MLALLLACGPKTGTPEVLGSGQTIEVAMAVEAVDGPTSIAGPDRLADALNKRLTARKLTPDVTATRTAEYAMTHSTQVRLDLVAESASTDLILLLEARPAFDAQIAGRFRWNVSVSLTLSPRSDTSSATTYDWEIPVFLQFYHQQEDAALAEATPMIERRLSGALDEFLSGL